jgi:hypothetical protein
VDVDQVRFASRVQQQYPLSGLFQRFLRWSDNALTPFSLALGRSMAEHRLSTETHDVVLGGSWATIPRIAGRKTVRNWYQTQCEFLFSSF